MTLGWIRRDSMELVWPIFSLWKFTRLASRLISSVEQIRDAAQSNKKNKNETRAGHKEVISSATRW